MTTDRRTDHAKRAALLRLQLAEYRVAELPSCLQTVKGAEAAAELSRAIDGVVELLRSGGGPAPAQAPSAAMADAGPWDMIVRWLEERH